MRMEFQNFFEQVLPTVKAEAATRKPCSMSGDWVQAWTRSMQFSLKLTFPWMFGKSGIPRWRSRLCIRMNPILVPLWCPMGPCRVSGNDGDQNLVFCMMREWSTRYYSLEQRHTTALLNSKYFGKETQWLAEWRKYGINSSLKVAAERSIKLTKTDKALICHDDYAPKYGSEGSMCIYDQ